MEPRRDVLDTSMRWMDALWDDDVALLWAVRRDRHMTRETSWYALGLLQRGDPDDVPRAERALRAVIGHQFPADGSPFAGTFRRAPEEPDPPDDPVMWVHYDPNWRQFIGTTLALIIDGYADRLSGAVVDEMRGAIERAVAGEPDDRVAPTYANIALMKAWLDGWAGRHEIAMSLARATYEHFAEHGVFLEYNSPTYYGIDLSALALWRSTTGELRRLGSDMEQRLWRDVARFYHAGLRNLCGPYDRAYGMDMTRHATPLGLYIWSVVGRERAAFPDPANRFSHPHDFCFGPMVAATPTSLPDDVLPHLEAFQGEREIHQVVSDVPKRIVTAWLGQEEMFGGWEGPASGIGFFQHAHGTIHTRTGWMRLLPETPARAYAEPRQLIIESAGPVKLETRGRIEIAVTDTTVRWTIDDGDDRRLFGFERPQSGESWIVLNVLR